MGKRIMLSWDGLMARMVVLFVVEEGKGIDKIHVKLSQTLFFLSDHRKSNNKLSIKSALD